ncbi:MAG: DNA gyrase/topoisomerase IV subunit A [Prevotella sp.]|nr:DNA gyrase/topoisomerase IV subunit A [Prevotella sp.]MCM1074820.1 DNA gyrase/topoisomerase IV subunit A [Ruminococcus sp.]
MDELLNDNNELQQPEKKNYTVPGQDRNSQLSNMYQQWFLEYASYVILERAVPHIEDGLKPVQRRILHSMYTLDDGRFNKVANVVGNTMQYHPHGDASIADALVQLGQKDLLVDTQGNWGNILTGDGAAASRYIEARLSEFALETIYSPKVTEWTPSYDGRKKEPITLPAKFPLLLAQGVEGIAVGLSSKILPHNFVEICDAAVSCLKGEEFKLYPDFQTGGFIDVSRYNDGERGGAVKVRAKIDKIDNKTLAITEVPFGKTTTSVINSVINAQQKGKIKVKSVVDHTSATANIIVHLQPGTSSDKAIDALYAFTDCEVSISPNCCVINEEKPHFLTVSDVLKYSVNHTRRILLEELNIELGETREEQMFASLEKIFIEERIYKDKPLEQAPDMDAAVAHIFKRIEPWADKFFRPVTREDVMRLWEIRMGRILKFNADKANDKIAALDAKIAQLLHDIEHIVEYTINWFSHLKEKYGHKYPRRTVIRGFDAIAAAKVAEANKRLYIDREGGFAGTGLKDSEFVAMCSDIDDIIIFYKDGKYKIVRVSDKFYVGKNVLYINVFKRGDKRTIYNMIYRNGKGGPYYMKRFAVPSLTRDKEYDATKSLPGSKVVWFTANPNGEAEVLRITLKAKLRLKVLQFDINFADLAIKGKEALGNLVTKNDIARISLKEKGGSTLGGRAVWWDPDVLRLNYDGRGEPLGEFQSDDLVLVVMNNGEFFTTSFADTNHYDEGILRILKFNPDTVWTAVLNDASQGYPYIKRFTFEPSAKSQRFVGEDEKSSLIMLTDTPYPRLKVEFGGADSVREPMVIEADEFIGVKSFKAKGKRLTTFELAGVEELEPTKQPEPEPEENTEEEPSNDEEVISQVDVRDELTGQHQLFTDEP